MRLFVAALVCFSFVSFSPPASADHCGHGPWETLPPANVNCCAVEAYGGCWERCQVWVRAPPFLGPEICVEEDDIDIEHVV